MPTCLFGVLVKKLKEKKNNNLTSVTRTTDVGLLDILHRLLGKQMQNALPWVAFYEVSPSVIHSNNRCRNLTSKTGFESNPSQNGQNYTSVRRHSRCRMVRILRRLANRCRKTQVFQHRWLQWHVITDVERCF